MRAAIGLGSNLGNRRFHLEIALQQLHRSAQLRLLRCSRWYRTPPLQGSAASGWFLNGVALFECALSPDDLLDRCRHIEARAGRRPARMWGDRRLDLDVLVMESITHNQPHLKLPHPAIGRRPFVLYPLLEVWPDAVDDRSGRAYKTLPFPGGPLPVPVGVVAVQSGSMY